ncbi:MAG: HAMP domain-containing histidine kinase [Bacteroidetes bacterium]|nr:HAMP domain-containing histidine kinase [Bacteroidota bacterium]
MSKRSFRIFILITSLAMAGLITLQMYWFISSYQNEKDNFERLTDYAVRQINGKVLNYLSPDYLVQAPEPSRKRLDQEFKVDPVARPLRASKFLGYYGKNNDSIPVYGPNYVRDSVTGEIVDSLIRDVVEDLNIPPDYSFSVHDGQTDSLIYENAPGKAIAQPLKERQINIINPHGVNPHQTVRLYFPNKIGQILLRMGWILVANILLLMLIAGAFAFAFKIILKQKKIQQIRSDFISNLTHEFKTPVSTVSLALDGLIDYPIDEDPKKRSEYLAMARKENRRLGLMIERTLNIAAYERGSIRLKSENVDLHELIDEVVSNFDIHVQHRHGELITETEAEPSIVIGDRDHLLHVIYNLVDNANKYSPNIPHILVRTESGKPGWIRVLVSDKGQGIPPDRINQIFNPYTRASELSNAEVKGFGLGLAYVQKVVELHGGTITVESLENKGSCFTVQLPLP